MRTAPQALTGRNSGPVSLVENAPGAIKNLYACFGFSVESGCVFTAFPHAGGTRRQIPKEHQVQLSTREAQPVDAVGRVEHSVAVG